MDRRAHWMAVAIAAAGLGLTATPSANAHGEGRAEKRENPIVFQLSRNADRLNLDDAALARIREITESAKPERERLRDAVHSERKRMREMLQAEVPDEAGILAQADVLGQLRIEQEKQQLRTLLDVRNQLTPEQRAELARIREERRDERFGRRFGRRGHGARTR